MKNRDNATLPALGLRLEIEPDDNTQNVIFEDDGSVEARGGLKSIVPNGPSVVQIHSFTTAAYASRGTAVQTLETLGAARAILGANDSYWLLPTDMDATTSYTPLTHGYQAINIPGMVSTGTMTMSLDTGTGLNLPITWSLVNTDAIFSLVLSGTDYYLKATIPDDTVVTAANGWVNPTGGPLRGDGTPYFPCKDFTVNVKAVDATGYDNVMSFRIRIILHEAPFPADLRLINTPRPNEVNSFDMIDATNLYKTFEFNLSMY